MRVHKVSSYVKSGEWDSARLPKAPKGYRWAEEGGTWRYLKHSRSGALIWVASDKRGRQLRAGEMNQDGWWFIKAKEKQAIAELVAAVVVRRRLKEATNGIQV